MRSISATIWSRVLLLPGLVLGFAMGCPFAPPNESVGGLLRVAENLDDLKAFCIVYVTLL
jgi:hypothetical protein